MLDDSRQAGDVDSESVSAAKEFLASELFWKMERLDPSENPDWEELTDHQKNLYRLCVEHLLGCSTQIEEALHAGADDDAVNRRTKKG